MDPEQNNTIKKLKIGWFIFSCCEDNTIVFTELMNDHWLEWKKIMDITYARALRTKNIMGDFDIAFIEGALASPKHVEKAKQIRDCSKKVVAVGACAVTGMPSAQRNMFNEKQLQEIKELLDQFAALPKVLKVSDVIKVDAEVPGCPMDPDQFLKVTTAVITELTSQQKNA